MTATRKAYIGETTTFTHTVRSANGAVEDMSAATLVCKVMAPDGAIGSLTPTGASTGVVTITGTLAEQQGTHKWALKVNGNVRAEGQIIARKTAVNA